MVNKFRELYCTTVLINKRFQMYYGRAGGYWALRHGMKRW